MKKFISSFINAAVILIATALTLYSCSKGEEDYTLTFTSPALYFDYGQTQTATYRASGNVVSLTISTTLTGWTTTIDTSTGEVFITAPDTLEDIVDEDGNTTTPVANGTLVMRGYVGETSVSASIYVSLGDMVDMAGEYANSYILKAPQTAYRISAARPDGSMVENISSVDVVWSSARYLIRYPEYKNGKITFVTYNEDGKLVEGNALLAAYDEDENILWCWHLWVTGCEPEENAVVLNGQTFMGCNLGAFGNSTDSNDEILSSYGLYYQWGRPSPFPRPRYFDCANGMSESLYTSTISSISMTVEENDGVNSTMAEAIANPLVYVTGMESPWGGTARPWSDTGKSNYDPCPAGWRVPASNAFDGLTIVSDELAGELESLRKAYGWTLTDGNQQAFFFAGGRRTYTDGTVINMNTQDTPQPWEGFYWTSSLESSQAKAGGLYFDLNTVDAAESRINTARQLQLSNGLQIRCVRE